MDLDRVLSAVSTHVRLILVAALAAGVLGLAGTALAPKTYKATARGLVSVSQPRTRPPSVMTSGSLYVTARMSSYASQGTSSVVLDAVRNQLQLSRSDEQLRKNISSTSVVDTALIEVTVLDRDSVLAQRMADETVRQTAALIESLEHHLVVVTLSDPAQVEKQPTTRSYLVNPVAGLVGGLIAGAASAVVIESRRRALGRST